jgi:hypothetical protein
MNPPAPNDFAGMRYFRVGPDLPATGFGFRTGGTIDRHVIEPLSEQIRIDMFVLAKFRCPPSRL